MNMKHWFAASAILGVVLIGQPALADELIEEYNAYIGQDDLFNSDGMQLTQPWQVIRQDRANYHRFGISQPGDDGDSFFASAKNRERAERMIRNGTITRDARNAILGGDVTINVQIWRGNGGDYINVTVD